MTANLALIGSRLEAANQIKGVLDGLRALALLHDDPNHGPAMKDLLNTGKVMVDGTVVTIAVSLPLEQVKASIRDYTGPMRGLGKIGEVWSQRLRCQPMTLAATLQLDEAARARHWAWPPDPVMRLPLPSWSAVMPVGCYVIWCRWGWRTPMPRIWSRRPSSARTVRSGATISATPVTTWLYTIARRLALNHFRDRKAACGA